MLATVVVVVVVAVVTLVVVMVMVLELLRVYCTVFCNGMYFHFHSSIFLKVKDFALAYNRKPRY